MREMVLSLAMQGKLIAQNSNDSPASQLLKNITAGKRDVSKNSKSKLPNTLSTISSSDMPFEKPQGWEWVRLGDIAEIERGGSPRPIDDFLTNDPDGLNWIKIGDTVKGSKFIISTREKIKKEGLVKTRMVYPGDFLLTNSMSFGRPYITNIEGCIHDGWLKIHPPSCLEKDYLYHLLSSPIVLNFFLKAAAGAVVQNLNADKVRELPIPLPPLAEQSRIITKVDELMALCDRLEQLQLQRRKLQNALRQSMLQAVATATSPHELQSTWNRLSDNFGQLFSVPEDVEELRKLVLDLAVNGHLTERIVGDENIECFIGRCISAKTGRLSSGEMKRKIAAATDVDQLDITILHHWCTAQLDELFQFIDYRGKTPPKTNSGVVLVTAKNVRPGRLNDEPIEYISETSYKHLMTRGFPRAGDLLITTEAPLGNVARINRQPNFALAQRVINLQPFADLNTQCAMYFMMSPTFQNLLERNSSGMTAKGIKASKLKQLELPIPPIQEQTRIVERVLALMQFCDSLESQLRNAQNLAERLSIASISSFTGITNEQNEEPMKAPPTELIAPIRLGHPPDIKAQAPLAKLLTHHNGEMSAKDLWKRYGGEIDTFYAQLKNEVAHGWILEPEPAEMREKA